jgi:hypothetical protein
MLSRDREFRRSKKPLNQPKEPPAGGVRPLPQSVYNIDKTGISWYNYLDLRLAIWGIVTRFPWGIKELVAKPPVLTPNHA